MTRKNTTNRKYIESEKENLIKRMLPLENCSITVLSSKTGISKSTLSTWKKKAISGEIKNKPGRPRSGMLSHEKFLIVMETYTLKAKLEVLWVISSYSRPRVSYDNPFSEAQFKTMKYRPGYPKDGFKTIEDAREWVSKFVDWYNNEHYHSGLKFMTPASRHNGDTEAITTVVI